MNVVIYARYSSHNQQETSIEGQLKVCHEFCERNNYTVIHEYIDRAISGRTDNRPDFLQMIQDSASRHFDFIIVYQLDRFSRNRYDSAHYKNKLKKYGVRVLSARENINEDASGILMESVLEGMAEYYSAELSQKVKRGMEINASKCLCTGGNRTLGFFIDKDKKFQIDPATAPIVKLIFEMYANGKSIVEITEHLNSMGYKTIYNKPYGKNSIRNILSNKRYIGTYTYKDTEIPNGIPRIVSDELFKKKRVKKEYIEDIVVNVCRGLLTKENIDRISKEIAKLCEENQDAFNLKRLKKQLAENERKHRNLINAVAECDVESLRKSFYTEILDLESQKARIEEEIREEEKLHTVLTEPEIKFFLTSLKKGNADDIKYRKVLITTFINSIYLYDDKVKVPACAVLNHL